MLQLQRCFCSQLFNRVNSFTKATDLQIQLFPPTYHLLRETLYDFKSSLIFVETWNQRLASQRAVCLSSGTGPEVSKRQKERTLLGPPCIFTLTSVVSVKFSLQCCIHPPNTLLYKGVNKRDCRLSLPLSRSIKCAKFCSSQSLCNTQWDYFQRSVEVFHYRSSNMHFRWLQNITQRNTGSVSEPPITEGVHS